MALERETTGEAETSGDAAEGKPSTSRPERPGDVTPPPAGASGTARKGEKDTNIETKELKDSD